MLEIFIFIMNIFICSDYIFLSSRMCIGVGENIDQNGCNEDEECKCCVHEICVSIKYK